MPGTAEPLIVKTTGEREPFAEDKLRASLQRSGAGPAEVERVVGEVRDRLEPGMTTRKLYRIAFQALRKTHRPVAARYSLKKAIGKLGPSGFPFERFVGELWRADGFRVDVGVTLEGRFIRHEVDLVAARDGEQVLGECKFRIQADGKTDAKVAMYVYARSLDLQAIPGGWKEFWLITNGRFTADALRFGEGVGLRLLSWNHPPGRSLRDRIDRTGLHPITALTGLRKREVHELLARELVLCRNLCGESDVLEEIGLSARRIRSVLAEAEALCRNRP